MSDQSIVIFIKKVYKYVLCMAQMRMCSTHKNKQFDTVEIPLWRFPFPVNFSQMMIPTTQMYMSIFRSKGFLKFAADNILHIIAQFLEYFSHCCGRFCKERMHPPGFQFSCTKEERLQILSESVFFFYFQDLRDDTFVSNDTKNIPR